MSSSFFSSFFGFVSSLEETHTQIKQIGKLHGKTSINMTQWKTKWHKSAASPFHLQNISWSPLISHLIYNDITCTDKASYTLIHEILTAFNNKQIVGGIFCDLRKAFDVVNHKILLNKLQQYGIVGKFNALIKSYLTERYQRVVIQDNSNNSYSDWEIVKHGVPQGSILGPLFFYYL
jgi:hypothetical protein